MVVCVQGNMNDCTIADMAVNKGIQTQGVNKGTAERINRQQQWDHVADKNQTLKIK